MAEQIPTKVGTLTPRLSALRYEESLHCDRKIRASRLRIKSTLRVVICLTIFLLAFVVRVLVWHDTRLEVGKVQTVVTADYKRVAQLLAEGGVRSFFSSTSPLADANNLGHPPGYSILLAIIFGVFGQSDTAVQFVQIFADAISVVLIFLIVAELFPLSTGPGAGVVAGSLAALSPQLAWNSVLILPDSICVLPILIAIYLLARATRQPRLASFIIAGVLIGISCWLRANAMLLTLFVAAAVVLIFRASRMLANHRSDAGTPAWRFAGAVIVGTLLIVLPLTIRNAIVFHRFIPLSLGAGQTFLEGIADYDPQGRFGIPRTDMGIMKQEAEIYRRPDYFGTLFNPDGVERERARISRGLAVVRSHPFWFVGVMARRASSMVRLERSRLISARPSITNQIRPSPPTTVVNADELVAQGIRFSPGAQLSVVFDQDIKLTGDASPYGAQFGWPIKLRSDLDYLVQVPVRMERGRIRMSVMNPNGGVLSSAVAETSEEIEPTAQPITLIKLPFVTDDPNPRLVVSNEASANALAEMGPVEIYELGPARFLWTRYPRFMIHAIQKIFITAVILPLAIFGLLVVIFRKQKVALILLSTVPIYFFTVQSLVHTEYRYVLAVNYFLCAFAGVAICWLWHLAKRLARRSVPSA